MGDVDAQGKMEVVRNFFDLHLGYVLRLGNRSYVSNEVLTRRPLSSAPSVGARSLLRTHIVPAWHILKQPSVSEEWRNPLNGKELPVLAAWSLARADLDADIGDSCRERSLFGFGTPLYEGSCMLASARLIVRCSMRSAQI